MFTGDTLVWMFWLRPNLDCYGQREQLLIPPELEKFDNQQWFNGFEMNFWQVFPAMYKKKSSKPREQLRETFCHMPQHLKDTLKHRIYHRMRGRCSSGPVSKSCLEVWKCYVPFSYTFSIWIDTPAAPPPPKGTSNPTGIVLLLKEPVRCPDCCFPNKPCMWFL